MSFFQIDNFFKLPKDEKIGSSGKGEGADITPMLSLEKDTTTVSQSSRAGSEDEVKVGEGK
jgi:hypothetical protein